MQSTRIFCVVAYDISSCRRRALFVKEAKKYGKRVNKSVFECVFTPAQLVGFKRMIPAVVDSKDSIIIYRLCMDCSDETFYYPARRKTFSVTTLLK